MDPVKHTFSVILFNNQLELGNMEWLFVCYPQQPDFLRVYTCSVVFKFGLCLR